MTHDGVALRRLMIGYLLLATVPSLLKRIYLGRGSVTAIDAATAPDPVIVTITGASFGTLLIVACLRVYISRADRLSTSKSTPLFALLLIGIGGLIGGGISTTSLAGLCVNITVTMALLLLRPKLNDLRIFAHLGTLLGVASIAFGLVNDVAWRAGSLDMVSDKAIIGTGILAGPFSSSNNLGMSMALALPFAFLIESRALRSVEAGIIGLALLLSASRISIAAVLIGFLLFLLYLALSNTAEKLAVFSVLVVSLLGTIAAFPWLVSSRTLFTGRGEIWIASRALLKANPIQGYGFDAFRNGAVAQAIGHPVGGGHNPILHEWVVGGVLGLSGMLLLIVPVALSVISAIRYSAVPVVFGFVLLSLCVAEGPISPAVATSESWITIPSAVLIAWSPSLWPREKTCVGRNKSHGEMGRDALEYK